MASKEPIRFVSDHLQANRRRQYGTQRGGLVPCGVNKLHGHSPAGEQCPDCLNYLEMVEERSRKTARDAAKARSFKPGDTQPQPTYEYTVDDLRSAVRRRSAGQKLYEQTVSQIIQRTYPWDQLPASMAAAWTARAVKNGIVSD